MTVEEFKQVAGDFGVPVSLTSTKNLGTVNNQLGDIFFFSYCGVKFNIDSRRDYVSVNQIPVEVLKNICSNYPENNYGIVVFSENYEISRVKTVTACADEFCNLKVTPCAIDLNTVHNFDLCWKDDYDNLGVSTDIKGIILGIKLNDFLSESGVSDGVVASCRINNIEGFRAVMSAIAVKFRSLDEWARINNVETGSVDAELRKAANCFDKSFSVDSLVDGRGRNVSETENCVSCFQNNNVWYRQVSFFDEEGKKVIFTHYCVKRNAGPLKFNGEGVNIEIYNGEELVTDAVYPFDGTLSKDNIEFIKKAFAKASDYVTDIEAEKKVSNRK